MSDTPTTEIAREAIRLHDAYEANPHPMGGHGDPTRGPGFDLERHARQHHVEIARALLASQRRVEDLEKAMHEARIYHDDICKKWMDRGDVCVCGADAHNAKIDAALRAGEQK